MFRIFPLDLPDALEHETKAAFLFKNINVYIPCFHKNMHMYVPLNNKNLTQTTI